MRKTSSKQKRVPPSSFSQRSRDQFQRTVRLTQSAITRLESESKTVTLSAVCETTRELDDHGKGLKPVTVLRNPESAELFHQHSPAYQVRQQQIQKTRHRRSRGRINLDGRTMYRGLRAADLIQMIEELKTQVTELKMQQEKFKAERDESYHLRDEALQQNARQLAALTKLSAKHG